MRLSPGTEYKIVNVQSGTVLTALKVNSIVGSPYTASNLNHQKWLVVPAGQSDLYYLQAITSNSYLATVGGGSNEHLVIDAVKFPWNIVPEIDETKFRIYTTIEDKVIQLDRGSSASDAPIHLAQPKDNVSSQVWKFEIAGNPPPPPPPPTPKTLLAAVTNRRTVRLWDPKSGKLVHTVSVKVWTTQLVALQRLGHHVAFMNNGQPNLYVQDFLKHGAPGTRTVGHFDVNRQEFIELSPKGTRLAAANSQHITVYDVQKASALKTYQRPSGADARLARFREDDKWLAVGFQNSSIMVWNLQTWAERTLVMPPAPGKTGYPIIGLAWAPAFTDALLTSRLFDQNLVLWNTRDGTRIRTFFTHHSFQESWMSFFPGDRHLKVAIAGGPDASQPEYKQPQQGIVQIWRLLDHTPHPLKTIIDENQAFTRVDVSPDGSLITASPQKFRTVKVWDAKTYHHLDKIKNDGEELEHLGFTQF
ncbi:hypothetical protein Hypma_013346 [Hypsizygus marmoreus]|uniref:Ricin B lectin domain-containing protein n=1 Tax=Hypsizygus marmoreus TaxID=39966 RepID=A0A369JEK7_HYPMA|nr:hypothetical protein Hypma_013346 [Hypsizygus marmoreus]